MPKIKTMFEANNKPAFFPADYHNCKYKACKYRLCKYISINWHKINFFRVDQDCDKFLASARGIGATVRNLIHCLALTSGENLKIKRLFFANIRGELENFEIKLRAQCYKFSPSVTADCTSKVLKYLRTGRAIRIFITIFLTKINILKCLTDFLNYFSFQAKNKSSDSRNYEETDFSLGEFSVSEQILLEIDRGSSALRFVLNPTRAGPSKPIFLIRGERVVVRDRLRKGANSGIISYNFFSHQN